MRPIGSLEPMDIVGSPFSLPLRNLVILGGTAVGVDDLE
jgi:hypothetical protein